MRRRLLAGYLSISALTLVLLAVPLGRTIATREQDRFLADLTSEATVVAGLSEDAVEGTDPLELDPYFASYERDRRSGRIVVVDRSGRVRADSRGGPLGGSGRNLPGLDAALDDRRVGGRSHDDGTADHLWVAVPISSSGVVHGAVSIVAPTDDVDDTVRDTWWGLGALALGVLAAAALAGVALSRALSKPVGELRDAAARIAAGDLSARAAVDAGPPELRELARVFNDSAARQQELLESQRAFVADAAHQIRTPLAALRLQLENLESVAPLELQGDVALTRAEVARLGRLAETLLSLTRAAAPAARSRVELHTLLEARAEIWRPIFAEEGRHLSVDLDPAAPAVLAADGAVEQVVDNLVDNALVVSPRGSAVTLCTRRVGDHVELHVLDEGPGLSEADRRRAFDRFWRAPDAAHPGTGLGLAIVAELVASCGGSAELRPRSPRGIDATVVLDAPPVAPRD